MRNNRFLHNFWEKDDKGQWFVVKSYIVQNHDEKEVMIESITHTDPIPESEYNKWHENPLTSLLLDNL